MMRVSTSQIYGIASIGMTGAQSEINKTQEQMSTGKRVLTPADDPVAATSILQLNDELARLTQYSKNIDIGTNNLSLEDTVLQSVVGLVQRMQELAVSAGNTAVMSKADYAALASEVESRTQELLNLQNTRNPSGQFIFAGYQGSTQPFVNDGGGNYSYRGDDGQLVLKASINVSVAVTDSGKRVFADIASGHNTINTSANSTNKSSPPAFISAGQVYDQAAFDKFYPESMVITFNAMGAVSPPTPNYTITERGTGKVLVDKAVYISGEDIELNGVRFQVYGTPNPGEPVQPGRIPLGTFAGPVNFGPVDPALNPFSANPVVVAPNETLRISVGGVTESLVLDQNITTIADLVNALGGNPPYDPLTAPLSAQANFAKLQNLGITFDANGFASNRGLPISIQGGSANTTAVLGIPTQGNGTGAAIKLSNSGNAFDFSVSNRTLNVTVGSTTQTLTLDQNVTDMTSLVAALGSVGNGNAAKLAGLGLSITADGIITSSSTQKITIAAGDSQINSVMGIETLGSGTASAQGVKATPGDSFFIESTNKQSLLTTLSRFGQAMRDVENTPESKAELSKMINKTLKNLELSIANIATVQGEVGARMNTLEAAKDLNLDTELYTKKVLSEIESLDYAEASTRLSIQSLVLSATQQSFVKISQLNLFNYL